MAADRIDSVVGLAKRRGFVFASSEIYGGTRSAYDYGPLGVELKENVRRQWWRAMVQQRDDVVGLDSAIVLARQVWVASGHVEEFTDPLTECQSCHKRFRADHLEEAYAEKHGSSAGVARRDQLPELRQQGHVHRAPHVQRPDEDLPRPGRQRGGPALPASGDGAGHLRQLQQRRRRRAASGRRSASRRSARASATRSPRATSSSGPASSSRWRWSSSSSPAPTRSGTSTGSPSAGTGTSTSASARRTCATTSTRRRSSPTTPSAPSTSSTGSSSAAPSSPNWRASPTAPTST